MVCQKRSLSLGPEEADEVVGLVILVKSIEIRRLSLRKCWEI